MGNIKNVLLSWGEQKKAAPNLILDILHVRCLWRKAHISPPSPPLPTPSSNSLKKQSSIGCPQDMIGLISHNWAEIQNVYLQ